MNSFLNCLATPKEPKQTEFKIRFSSVGVKEKEKEDFLKEGDMFGETVLLFILTHHFFMRHSVKEKRNKADEVFGMTIESYASQESKWKVKIKYITSLLGGYTFFSYRSISNTLISAVQHCPKESQKTNS